MFSRAIPLLFLALINLIIAGFVFFNKKHLVNKLFAIFVCSVVGWTLSLFATYVTFGRATNLLWMRAIYFSSSLAPFSFLWFVEVFPDKNTIVLKKGLAVFTFLGSVFALLSFSPAIVTRAQDTGAGQYRPVLGLLHLPLTFYFLSCFGYAFFTFGRKWRKAHGLSRLQIQYLFLGLFLFCTCALTTNLIIPVLFNVYQFGIYGPYFTLFLVGFTAHAIIRYRLMDIKAVISKSMVYLISSAIAIGILFGLFFFIRRVVPTDINMPKEASVIVHALGGIIIFFPLKRLFQFLIDRYFYRETINLQQAMRNASRALASVLKQDELLNRLGQIVVEQMNVESAFIFLREEGENSFRCQLAKGYFDSEIDIPEPLSMANSVTLQEIKRRIQNSPSQEKFLVREELSRQSEDVIAQKISEELENLHCDVVFPLASLSKENSYRELVGMLFVGPKLSADPYFQTDLDLLSMVANQASIAIKNAQLYAEVDWMREYNENILRNMESGVITVDKSGIVKTFNEGAERLIGISREVVIGEDVTALDSNISTLILAALHRHELDRQSETTIKTQDNRSIPIAFSTSLLRDKSGEILGSLMVFSDLSRIKELEEDKRKMERLATVGSLASGLMHEMKNSLFPLRTFAELLPERYSDPEFRESFSQIALQQIDDINELVNQLRDLARPAPTNFTSVNIDVPIENVLNLLSGRMEKMGVQVIKEYAEEAPEICADESQLRQLFLNLMMNSLEAMPQGGKLYIKTYVQRFFSDYSFMCVDIKDTGRGIDEEDIEQVFDPFFTKREGGTGLGLTICRNIVDLHKGSIYINNNKTEKGVTVTVRFPIRAMS